MECREIQKVLKILPHPYFFARLQLEAQEFFQALPQWGKRCRYYDVSVRSGT